MLYSVSFILFKVADLTELITNSSWVELGNTKFWTFVLIIRRSMLKEKLLFKEVKPIATQGAWEAFKHRWVCPILLENCSVFKLELTLTSKMRPNSNFEKTLAFVYIGRFQQIYSFWICSTLILHILGQEV